MVKFKFTRILSYLLVTLLVACTAPPNKLPQATQPPIQKPKPSATLKPKATLTPIRVPTEVPTQAPTKRPVPTITNTVLPPLPDFDQIVTFGQGGGGEFCGRYPENGARMAVIGINPGRGVLVCFSEGLGAPLQLEWFAPDGRVFTSTLGLNGNTGSREFFMRWPINLPWGQWRIHASGSEFSADTDFFVPMEDTNIQYIYAIDPASVNQIQATGFLQTYGLHDLELVDNTNVNVIGKYYPANSPVYILVYHDSGNEWRFNLIHEEIIPSDNNGSIALKLSGLFEVGQSYLIIGTSDPNADLADSDNLFNFDIPHDYIYVVPSTTCPGAPPQRMVVNQRGYVCTQSDNVNLRANPSKSGGKLVEVTTGSQFTVIGGPACSDDWSWWQVQTDNGYTGWLSEGGDEVDPYFICLLP